MALEIEVQLHRIDFIGPKGMAEIVPIMVGTKEIPTDPGDVTLFNDSVNIIDEEETKVYDCGD